MMKLSPELRATIYCMMLAEIDDPITEMGLDCGMCWLLSQLFEYCWEQRYTDRIVTDLPELHAQKPIGARTRYYGWDKDGKWDKRKIWIKNALKIVEQKIQLTK